MSFRDLPDRRVRFREFTFADASKIEALVDRTATKLVLADRSAFQLGLRNGLGAVSLTVTDEQYRKLYARSTELSSTCWETQSKTTRITVLPMRFLVYTSAMENLRAIPEALSETVRLMVENPSEMTLAVIPSGAHLLLRITVAPRDMGVLIGKQGRTARALRVILGAMAAKSKQALPLGAAAS